ncbi:MAG: WD40 repeat domain-containing protein, partial [Cyanobacteriota bacterium]|nr:WD40 repeat domain-containing protein [Cyanobacteriota bacterium]
MAEHDACPQDCIRQDITKPRYAAISATGDSNITIVNYFGGHFSTGSTESHGGAGLIRDDDCPCPYRELYPFDQNDAALFFGREAATERLRLALRRRNVLPLLGASGSGKSSLVFAGLVPLLHKEGHWRYCYFRPQTSPFMELARALLPLYAPSLNETERLGQTEQLAAQLKEKKILLSNVLAEIRHRAPHDQILLIGDQFEELYSPTLKQEERQAFLDVLFQAFAHDGFNATAGPVRLLLTMRADFLGNALAHRSFASLFQQEGEGKDDVKLGPMSELELREAIEKPAAAYGVGFESGLVERILSELATEPGYLPLMEFTLTKLWSLREGALITHEAYTGIGGVKGALAQYADGCLSDLEPAQQVETRRVFLQLVRPGEGTEDTRRLATRQELGEDHWPLVCRLADDRLVVTSRNAVGDDTVEVVHEALIRHWGKLQDWLSTDRDFRSWQERLRGSLAQWQANDYEEGGLLRGAALAVARARLQERQEDLGTIEQEFIAASAAAEEGARRRERRRQRLLFSGLAGGLALVTVALLLAWGQLVRAQRQRGKALEATAKLLVVEQPVDAMITALASVGPTRYGQMFPIVEHLPAIVTQVLLEGEAHRRENTRLRGHRGRVRAVSLSSDGTRIVSGGEDGTVRLWDVQKGRMIGKPLYADDGWIESVSFSGDGSRILSAGHKSLRIWDVSTGNAIGRPPNDILFSDATSASLSRNGKLIVSGNSRGKLHFWDAENGEAITEGDIWGHEGWVRSVVFSKDGSRIVSAGDDGTVRLWDVKSKRAVGEPLRGHQGIVLSAAFNPDGSQIVSAGQDGTVRLWNAQSGRPIGTPLRGHNEGWVRSAAFSTDGSLIVSAGDDGTVRLWDAKSGNAIGEPLRGHLGVVMSAGMSANGRFIVSAGEDETVRLWQKTSEAGNGMPLRGHDGEVRSAAFNSDGNLIVSGGYDGTVRLWNAKTGQQVGEPLLGHEGAVGSVAFNKEGSQIVSAGEDG